MKRLLLILLLFVNAEARAQLANQPPIPQWLGLETAASNGTMEVGTEFEHRGNLLKAILLVAADADTEVLVNDKPARRVPTSKDSPATSLDLTSSLVNGKNKLRLRTTAPKVAALLELNGDLAQVRWIASDANTWTSAGGKVLAMGAVDADPATNPFDLKKTFDAYNSWQLAKPGAQSQATDPKDFTLLPGFKAELVRSAQPGEDSWVAMAFDPQGRITLSKEKKGLLRFDPKSGSTQVIEDSLLECRGLVYAHGVLYANANNSKGLYRLRDVDGDGIYEHKEELMHTEGGVGHGRNHIKLGPDGRIWIAHGNNVLLPSGIAPDSPLKNYANDQVLPNPWDGSMFDGTVELPAGHILAYDPKDGRIELFAGGLRNPLDIAFNDEDELFTFDADMERDVGTSWYMPTRVLHVVPGADFGWRRGTGRLPSYYADTLPSVVDIGLSSPTGICFGYGTKFPMKYQFALFVLDWSYGRIIAVDMRAKGASYEGTQETFVSGRPLNVTDACVGPDGALWFTTGGRGTQSGLYRVTWEGGPDEPFDARDKVMAGYTPWRMVQELRGKPSVERIWQFLQAAHHDRHLLHEGRLALEKLPLAEWRSRALAEPNKFIAIPTLLALARAGDDSDRLHVLRRLATQFSFITAHPPERLGYARVAGVALARLKTDIPPDLRLALIDWAEEMYGDTGFNFSEARRTNRELCRLLVRLGSKQVVAKSLAWLKAATSSEDLLFYPLHLRYVKDGWTMESKRIVFEALNRAEKLNGASTYFKAIQDTRGELAAALSAEEMKELASVVHPPKPAALSPHAMPGHTFRVWKIEDLEKRLPEVAKGRSFEKGKAAAIAAQCVFCHTMSTDRTLPAGLFGPELVQVSARFGRRDLLDHILNPSKVVDEKFRFITITQADGKTVSGSLESEDDERVTLKPNPLSPETVEIGKSSIRTRVISETSPMPPGLLNALKAEQILDLLAFIEAGGDPAKANFQP